MLKQKGKVFATARCPKCRNIENEVPFTPDTEYLFSELRKEQESGIIGGIKKLIRIGQTA